MRDGKDEDGGREERGGWVEGLSVDDVADGIDVAEVEGFEVV